MPTSDKHSVSGQELDSLLKQAFLNLDLNHPKNDTIMETVANATFQEPVLPASAGSGNSFLTLKILLSGLGSILVISAVVYLFVLNISHRQKANRGAYSFDEAIRPAGGEPAENAAYRQKALSPSPGKAVPKKARQPVQMLLAEKEPEPQPSHEKALPATLPAEVKIKSRDSLYVFPVLTEVEIKANHKQKKQMIDQLIKLNKDRYAYIPMGSCLYGKDTISCQAFYMQTTEVTNLEYRTFLFDLLIEGKKAEFLKAKPDQEQWNKKFGQESYFDPMKQMYFSHPAYNDYPVVNISREGAEMYCIWLSIAANERLKEKGKPLMNDLRLPMDYEWAYAASNKEIYARYANGTPNLRNSKGLYIQNYNCDTYANSRYDSIHDVYLFHKTEDGKGPVTDGGFLTTVKKAYPSNAYGLYDLAGNVSEMVYLLDGNTNRIKGFGTKGGSWCSPDYFLEIDALQEFKHPGKPSPLIGFRPVMTAIVTKR